MRSIAVDISNPADSSAPALEAARAIMNAGDHVYLLHNVGPDESSAQIQGSDELPDEAREHRFTSAREALLQLANRFSEQAEPVIIEANSGWQALITYAVDHGCDLLVAQTAHSSGWKRWGLARDDWELIRHCPMPLLLARERGTRCCSHITAAIDPLHIDDKPADLDRRILQTAGELASQWGSRLTVLNVNVPVVAVGTAMQPLPGDILPSPRAVSEQKAGVERFLADIGCKPDELLMPCGLAADEIVRCVTSRQSDLVVMGAVSRSFLARLLIGNTAERVLDRMPCDVMIVKPCGFRSRLPALGAVIEPAKSIPGSPNQAKEDVHHDF